MIYSVTQNASSEQIHIISALQYTCVIALVGMAVSLMVRPEPMKMVNKVNDVKSGKLQGLSKLLKTEISTAALSTATATGVMVAVMSLNTLIMYDHHHTAVDISTVVTLHVIGMYAFSMPLGRLADRWGRISVMLTGMFTEIISVMLLLISSQVAFVTFAMFLVGLGWSAVWVASSAYIADHTEPGERGSVTGATDAAAAGASITLPLLTGVMLELGGVTALVASAVNVSLPAVYFCLKILKKGWFKA